MDTRTRTLLQVFLIVFFTLLLGLAIVLQRWCAYLPLTGSILWMARNWIGNGEGLESDRKLRSAGDSPACTSALTAE